jgi:hypothetical protein
VKSGEACQVWSYRAITWKAPRVTTFLRITPLYYSTKNMKVTTLGLFSTTYDIWQWCGTIREWHAALHEVEVPILVKEVFGFYHNYDINIEEELVLFGGSFYDIEENTRTRMDTDDLFDREFSLHSDKGFRVCALVRSDCIPQELVKLISQMPRIIDYRLYLPMGYRRGNSVADNIKYEHW